jgi:hypothetical protein
VKKLVALLSVVCLGACGGGASVVGATGTTAGAAASASPAASATIDPAAIPLGDNHTATTAQVGYVDSCQSTFPSTGAGASAVGPWIDTAAGTWNSTAKTVVQGSVAWPSAASSFTASSVNFVMTGNGLPVGATTGTFPIASTDPAYQYDQNANRIAAQTVTYTVPLNPTVAAAPTCLNMGTIGVLTNGVVLYDALDALGRDAVAHEEQDSCKGHPDQSSSYHYHAITNCITDVPDTNGHSALMGYALDGFGIYGNLDVGGVALTNAKLDTCHGHVGPVMFHGTMQTIYHYHATREFPYTLGCYKGTPVATH